MAAIARAALVGVIMVMIAKAVEAINAMLVAMGFGLVMPLTNIPRLQIMLISLFLAGCIVFMAILVASQIYEGRKLIRQFNAEILSGGNVGRKGLVVSHYMFDILVVINVSATEAERKIMEEKALQDNLGWKRPEEAATKSEDVVENFRTARSWLREWRWNVKFSPAN